MQTLEFQDQIAALSPEDCAPVEVQCRLIPLFLSEETLSELLGPAYPDNTRVVNRDDPMTFDCIWDDLGGVRVADPAIHPVYLFSWADPESPHRIYGVVLDTLADMLNGEAEPEGFQMDGATRERGRRLLTSYREYVPILPGVQIKADRMEILRFRFSEILRPFYPHLLATTDGSMFTRLSADRLSGVLEMLEVFPDRGERADKDRLLEVLIERLEDGIQGDDISRLWLYLERAAVVMPELELC